jgi:hypothetical protein
MHRRAAFFVVGGVLVVVVIALLGELLVPRMTSRVVNVGNVQSLTPGTPLDWQHRLWVVLDKRGGLHAFPYMYEATPTRLYQTRWLDSTDSLAQTWFKNDPCVLAVGDGIFYVQSPSGTRYDATGQYLFGAERPMLDWYETRVDSRGEISVDLGKRHRTEYSGSGTLHGSQAKPGTPGPTATPSPVPTPSPC